MPMKAARHPKLEVSHHTTGRAVAEPIEDPALKIPTPNARCRAENHSDMAFAAAGQFPGSPKPNKNRQSPKVHVFHAAACKIAATDQRAIKHENPRFVPRRSTMYPEPAYMIAYARKNAATTQE